MACEILSTRKLQFVDTNHARWRRAKVFAVGRFHKSKDTVKKNVLGERSHSMAFLICGLEWLPGLCWLLKIPKRVVANFSWGFEWTGEVVFDFPQDINQLALPTLGPLWESQPRRPQGAKIFPKKNAQDYDPVAFIIQPWSQFFLDTVCAARESGTAKS